MTGGLSLPVMGDTGVKTVGVRTRRRQERIFAGGGTAVPVLQSVTVTHGQHSGVCALCAAPIEAVWDRDADPLMQDAEWVHEATGIATC